MAKMNDFTVGVDLSEVARSLKGISNEFQRITDALWIAAENITALNDELKDED